jgi:hypothetical protein
LHSAKALPGQIVSREKIDLNCFRLLLLFCTAAIIIALQHR